jgi:glycolate oxidase iron-sulfur subunit
MAVAAEASEHVADHDRLLECVHCGLCLSACPTYVELGTEMDSPRGRIYLMRGIEDGTMPMTADVVRHLDLCLGCRACETACPSGVQYGALIEGARAYVEEHYRRPSWERAWRAFIRAVFSRRDRIRLLLKPVRTVQAIGLWRRAQKLVPFADLLPEMTGADDQPAAVAAEGIAKARVALLTGCVAAELCAQTNRAAARVLATNGVTVIVPRNQGCCGALHLHSGDREGARRLARAVIDAFADPVEAVIVTAAGCGSTMKEYGELLADDADYRDRARAFAARVRDVTEFLSELPVRPPRARLNERVTYHDACHLAHAQQVREAPRSLLRSIPGLEIVELEESDMCCGSAGSYNLTEPAMARRLLERKVLNIASTGASCVVAANPGCSLQIQAGLRAGGLSTRVAHPVELLDEAYAKESAHDP